MIPICISLKGFMSYKDRQELRFDEPGLWVLEGPNGVGKSTLFDAITFVMFGQHRLGKQKHQDLINHDSDSLEVELTLRIEDATYKLHRTVQKGKGRPTWQIWQQSADGRFVAIAGTEQQKPYEAWVKDRLGLDYEGFTASVLLLQGESEKLIKQDPEGRRKLLGQLIDLSRYERLHALAKDTATDYRRKVEDLTNKQATTQPVEQADVDLASSALAAATATLDELELASEALNRQLPLAEQHEDLLRQRTELQRRQETEQEILSQAVQIRARLAELDGLAPLLQPLRALSAALAVLNGTTSAAAQDEARADELKRRQEAALRAEDEARAREGMLRQVEEDQQRRDDALRGERDSLVPLQARWQGTESLRLRVARQAEQLASQQRPDQEGTLRERRAAGDRLRERRAAEARILAEQQVLTERLRSIDGLAGRIDGQGGADAVTCRECGQPVTRDHVATERRHLLAQRDRLADLLGAATQACVDAANELAAAERAHEAAQQQAQLHAAQEQDTQNLNRVLGGMTPEQAEVAMGRLATLEQELSGLKVQREAHKRDLRDVQLALRRAGEEARETGSARQGIEQHLHQVHAKRLQAQGQVDLLREQLPERCHQAGPEQVAQIEQRLAELSPYRDRWVQLQAAEAGEVGRSLADVARQLAALPDGLPPLAEVRQRLAKLGAQREAARQGRDERAKELHWLLSERERRADLEAELSIAGKEQRLYGLLADLLGPEELQRRLVRDAEQAIVHLANQQLSALTKGQIRLALRPGKEGEDAAQKALDLLVYNQETGDQATALGLASGSQKFRIAISLALAIGRYLARETRRVESVIIDEGFGCLDRASREEAVGVLQELGKQMARVILVSHQEEFTGRFSSGYRIDLVDHTSVPTRVSR